MIFQKLYAFLRRDFFEKSSYKFNFISSVAGIFISTATFFFIAKLIPGENISSLVPYGGGYFSFVIIGIAFSGILGMFQEGLPDIIRNAQMTGTLEAILVTRTSISTVLIGSSFFNFLMSFIRTIFHLGIAIFVFGMTLGNIHWIGAIIVFVLTVMCFLSIGILSTSFILVYKLGNPFSWIFGGLSGLFGGIFFPIEVLPGWLKWISYLLPITHSLRGLRLSLLSSVSFSQIMPSIIVLACFSLVLLPLSFVVFRVSILKAKKDGTLTHY